MKNRNRHNILLSCMVVMAAWLMGSCDDDIMGGTTVLGFPTDTLVVDATCGETVAVSFNVGYNWNINSDKDWCRINGEDKSLGGKPGEHTVNFVVNDRGNLFADDRASITLYMNGESRVIAYITRRAAKAYEVEVSSNGQVYADGESLIIGAEGKLVLDLSPNFDMDLLKYDCPSWVQMERDGKVLTLSVMDDSMKYVINNANDSLRMTKDSTVHRSFHVQYAGMNPREIRISQQLEEVLVVSYDAKQAFLGAEEYEMPVSFSIVAANDEYEIVSLGYDESCGYYILSEDEGWVTIQDDAHGVVEVSVNEINALLERQQLLMALPQAITDSLGGTAEVLEFLCEEVEGMMELREEAALYRMVEMKQESGAVITIDPEAQWNIRVAVDGKTYCDAIMGDTCDAPMKVAIETLEGYDLVCVSYDSQVGCQLLTVEDSWLDVADDSFGNVEIGFKENVGSERIMHLFALPLPFAEAFGYGTESYFDKLAEVLFWDVDGLLEIKDNVGQFVVAKFVQEADEANAMKVFRTKATGMEVLAVTKETDPEWLAIATAKGVEANKVFRCSLDLSMPYIINPLLPLSVWDTSNADNQDRVEIYAKSGVKYKAGKGAEDHYTEEHGIMEEIEGNYMLVTLSANIKNVTEDGTIEYFMDEDFIIYFIDADTNILKALVITRL